MKVLRLIFNQKSYFSNLISSDMIIGGFLYYLAIEDKIRFEKYLRDFKNYQPPFLVSGVLPHDYLPFLGGNFVEIFDDISNKDQLKKLKKINYLKKVIVLNLKNNLNYQVVLANNADLIKDSKIQVNIKDRRINDGENLPYEIDIYHFKEKEKLINQSDIYLKVFNKEEESFIIDFLKKIFTFYGLGKKANVGFNQLKLSDIDEIDFPDVGDYFINLSAFIPKKDEKNQFSVLSTEIVAKRPKHGKYFGGDKPFKRQIFYLKEGSLFKLINKKEENDFFGEILTSNLSLTIPSTIGVYYCFPFYFNL